MSETDTPRLPRALTAARVQDKMIEHKRSQFTNRKRKKKKKKNKKGTRLIKLSHNAILILGNVTIISYLQRLLKCWLTFP